MSDDLWKMGKEIPAGTLFWGGPDRGYCVQLTHVEDGNTQFITVSCKYLPKLIEKLQYTLSVYRGRGK